MRQAREGLMREYARWSFESTQKTIATPILAVGALTFLGIVAEHLNVVHHWYASTYVALTAVIANRVCARAAVIATALAAPAFNYFFLAPKWAFQPVTMAEATIYASMLVVALLVAPRRSQAPDPPRTVDRGPELPFTGRRRNGEGDGGLHGTGLCYWDVQPTGNWAADCHLGGEYARIYKDRALHGEGRPLFAWIVRDMIQRGKFTGIEAGFSQALAQSFLLSAAARRRSPRESRSDH